MLKMLANNVLHIVALVHFIMAPRYRQCKVSWTRLRAGDVSNSSQNSGHLWLTASKQVPLCKRRLQKVMVTGSVIVSSFAMSRNELDGSMEFTALENILIQDLGMAPTWATENAFLTLSANPQTP